MIRPLNEKDFPQLLSIENVTQIAPWTLETFERCWQAGYLGWVIEKDHRIIGFIVITLNSGESHILNLGVHPDFQRQGYGKELMEFVLNYAKEQGISMVFLEVRKSNLPAMKLYEKLGFVQIGERKAYYATPSGREDALVFAKDLRV